MLCRSMEDAEDLAHDTIVKMLINRNSYNTRSDIKPWCAIIMRNTYITSYNRQKCIEFVPIDNDYIYISSTNAVDGIIFSQTCSIIRECACISSTIESVVLYAKGFTYDEISELKDIPIGTVKSRIAKGRALIKRKLDY